MLLDVLASVAVLASISLVSLRQGRVFHALARRTREKREGDDAVDRAAPWAAMAGALDDIDAADDAEDDVLWLRRRDVAPFYFEDAGVMRSLDGPL